MSEPQPGPELDAAIGKLMGLDVLGVSGCSREPECGEWEPTGQWAESGRERAQRAVYLRHCCCEFAEDADSRLFGHISYCLAVVPAYSSEIGAAWTVVERLADLGHTKWEIGHDAEGYTAMFSRLRPGLTCEHLDVESCCCCWEWVQRAGDSAPLAICRAALCVLEVRGG